MKKLLLTILTIIIFNNCNNVAYNDKDLFLISMRSIYKPLVENHINLQNEIKKAFLRYLNQKEGLSSDTLINLNHLKIRQQKIFKNAQEVLDKIPNDNYGFKKEVLNFTNHASLNLFPTWELLIANLGFYSDEKEIVFTGSKVDQNKTEIHFFDTVYVNTLKELMTNEFGFIYYENSNGININKYLDYMSNLTVSIYNIDLWYCEQNKNYLDKKLISEIPMKEALTMNYYDEEIDSLIYSLELFTEAIKDLNPTHKYNNIKLEHSNDDYYKAMKEYDTLRKSNTELVAINYLKKQLNNTQNSMIALEIGNYYAATESYDSTFKYLEKAIEIDRNNYIAFNNLGICYSKIGNDIKALLYYDKSLNINPSFALGYSNRGLSNYRLQRYQTALKDILEAEKIDPSNKAFQFNKRLFLKSLGINSGN